jgi:predicted regulator of Ras-like GTPase activity (Roadblock/LC7/MglB family)
MASLFQESSLSGLDRALIEGSRKKLVIHRNQRRGDFAVIIGRETMNIGLAGLIAKNISSAVEATLEPKT